MRYGHTESGTARKLTQQRKSLHQQSQIGTVLQLLAGGIAGTLGYSDEEDQLQQASVHSLAAGCILPHKIPFIT
ncbi:hypothetical protein VitviT2T_024451 [Vitis vinifera]|uniref:Uncharacterized protein n=1 Tax=Vitis vinifera TaxID=29760 RepID=A0ABY9DJH5_VITVI|nr:hypothetical protein VitviT2T_024451 [Vitis vinifera]